MEHGECPIQLSEEVLNLIEMHDIAIAEQLSLSLHAMSGSEGDNCLRLRALVGNQVMLILVDSGSSNSFINANMLECINCEVTDVAPLPVKVANGQYMYTTKLVPALQLMVVTLRHFHYAYESAGSWGIRRHPWYGLAKIA
jgi:hypothetical protein